MEVGNRLFAFRTNWPNEYKTNLGAHGIGGWEGQIVDIRANEGTVKFTDGSVLRIGMPWIQSRVLPHLRMVFHHEKYCKNVEVYQTQGQGKGVRATQKLPRDTVIDHYPGRVNTLRKWETLRRQGLTGPMYPLELPRMDPATGRLVHDAFIIDPGIGRGIDSNFKDNVTPYLNEPNPGQKPNCYWVVDVRDPQNIFLSVYTHRIIEKGEQLLLCYGHKYARGYKSSCTSGGLARGYVWKDGQNPVQNPKKDLQWTGKGWKWVLDDAAAAAPPPTQRKRSPELEMMQLVRYPTPTYQMDRRARDQRQRQRQLQRRRQLQLQRQRQRQRQRQLQVQVPVVPVLRDAINADAQYNRVKRLRIGAGRHFGPTLWASTWSLKQKKANPSLTMPQVVAMAHAEAAKGGYTAEEKQGLRDLTVSTLRKHIPKLQGTVWGRTSAINQSA